MKIGHKMAWVCGALLVLAGVRASWGRLVQLIKVDAAVAITNTEAWIKQHPKDAQGYYMLGRLHSMAWADGEILVLNNSGGDGNLPRVGPWDSVKVSPKETEKKDAEHIAASIAAYQKAVELDPKTPLYQLGLGWMLQKAGENARSLPAGDEKLTDAEKAKYAALVKQLGDQDFNVREAATTELRAAIPGDMEVLKHAKTDDPEVAARIDGILSAYWNLQALEHYRVAYLMTVESDLKAKMFDATDSPISLEAGRQILEILKAHPEAANKDEFGMVQDAADKLTKIPNVSGLMD